MSGGCLEGVWKVSGRCLDGVWMVSGPKKSWTKFILCPNFFVSTHTNQTKPNQIGPELGTAQPQLVTMFLIFFLFQSEHSNIIQGGEGPKIAFWEISLLTTF